ncbi:MAG TPA: thioesterase family protein [Azospirillaceae bacterium]|nr:thioesterase family protein [Azospirillaceae bacterium]
MLSYKGTVYPWHCDMNGHMNVMWYVGKFDEATWNLFDAAGLSSRYLREESRGLVAVEQHLSYRRELFAGEVVEVRSRVLEVKDKAIRFHHAMMLAGTDTVAATCELTGIHIDAATRKAVSLPAAAMERLRGLMGGA